MENNLQKTTYNSVFVFLMLTYIVASLGSVTLGAGNNATVTVKVTFHKSIKAKVVGGSFNRFLKDTGKPDYKRQYDSLMKKEVMATITVYDAGEKMNNKQQLTAGEVLAKEKQGNKKDLNKIQNKSTVPLYYDPSL